VFFTNVCNAKNTVNRDSVTPFQLAILANDEEIIMPKPALDEENEVFNPEIVIAHNRNHKTMEEIISEGDKIIENTTSDDLEFMIYEESMKEIIVQSDLIIENSTPNEVYPLFNQKAQRDKIAELENIIESKDNNEVRPLDFKKINSNFMVIDTINSEDL